MTAPEPPAAGRAQAPEDDPATQAWQLMSQLVLDEDRRSAVAEAIGLSFARTRALRRLADGPRTMRELATMLSSDPPYVTLMVDDLEQRGLAERTVHPEDRRARLVRLTDAGHAAAAQADEILRRPPAALQTLPAGDVATLLRLLERIASADDGAS